MTANRLWIAGTAILVAAVLALGWVLGISPKLAEASAADKTRESVDAANTISLQELASLKKQFEGIEGIRDELYELQKSIPVDADLPDFIRQLNAMGAKYGVAIESITTNDASIWTKPEVPPTDADGKPIDISSVPDTFAIVPIALKVSGSYAQILAFAQALQHGERLFLMGTFVVTTSGPGEDGVSVYDGEIGGVVFVLEGPRARPEEPREPEPEPTPTATPIPTGSGTPTPTPTP